MSVPFIIPDYDKFVDYRDGVPGDSYNPVSPFFKNALTNFTGIAVHHTAGPASQKIDDIAWYHVNTRGWGGIGYHFIIPPDGVIHYVGDLSLGRAHIAGLNDKYIGVCMIGSFMGNSEPTKQQLDAVHHLCKEFIENERDRFPNVNDWNDVTAHGDAPGQATSCCGDSRPNWWRFILNGVEDNCVKLLEASREDLKKAERKVNQYKDDLKIKGEDITKLEKKLEVAKGIIESNETEFINKNKLIRELTEENEDYSDEIEELKRLVNLDLYVGEALGVLVSALLNKRFIRPQKENEDDSKDIN